MRSWISATSSFESVVTTVKVLSHSPVLGSFQFSHRPPSPTGEPSFMPTAYGCLPRPPLIAFHSKNRSTGTRQRRRA